MEDAGLSVAEGGYKLGRGTWRIQPGEGQRKNEGWEGALGEYRMGRGTGRIQAWQRQRENTGLGGAQR